MPCYGVPSVPSTSHSQPPFIPPAPSSQRPPSVERNFFADLLDDLTIRVEWLEQVIDSVPDSGALAQLRGWAHALKELHRALGHMQQHQRDVRFKRLFALEGPLAAFISRLYAWCEEMSGDFEALAVKLRRNEPVLVVFSHHAVNKSFVEFQRLGAALRESLVDSRRSDPEAVASWATFDQDFEELLWATEWMHMSLAKRPGA